MGKPSTMLALDHVPLPGTWTRAANYGLARMRGVLDLVDAGRLEEFDLPPYTVQELIGADISTDGKVLDLCRSFGPLGIRREELQDALDQGAGTLNEPAYSMQSVDDFRAGVAALTCLVLLKQVDVGDAQVEDLPNSWPAFSPWPVPETWEEVKELYDREIRRGLLAVHLRADLRPALDAEEHRTQTLGLSVELRKSLYSLCVVEILNASLADQTFRPCQRPKCPRVFRPRRYDARYCSKRCSDREAARRHRIKVKLEPGHGPR